MITIFRRCRPERHPIHNSRQDVILSFARARKMNGAPRWAPMAEPLFPGKMLFLLHVVFFAMANKAYVKRDSTNSPRPHAQSALLCPGHIAWSLRAQAGSV